MHIRSRRGRRDLRPSGRWLVAAVVVLLCAACGSTGASLGPGAGSGAASGAGAASWQALPGTMISAGGGSTCWLDPKGLAWCWGGPISGPIDNTPGMGPNQLIQFGAGTKWKILSTGGGYLCAIKTNDTAWCAGNNDLGQLGIGGPSMMEGGYDPTIHNSPLQVEGPGKWATIVAGHNGDETCGIKTDHTAWCWGLNGDGELGVGDKQPRTAPARVSGDGKWAQIAVGAEFTCGIQTDSSLWCWGNNVGGMLGDGTTTNRLTPVRVAGGGSWSSVSAGLSHTCAIKSDQSLWCWGSNDHGDLGGGTDAADATHPVEVAGGKWGQISLDIEYGCGVQTDHTAWCWGNNSFGQLGDGTTTDHAAPAQVGTGHDWQSISAAGGGDQNTLLAGHVCAVKVDRTVWCWGINTFGAKGGEPFKGPFTRITSPVQIDTEAAEKYTQAGSRP